MKRNYPTLSSFMRTTWDMEICRVTTLRRLTRRRVLIRWRLKVFSLMMHIVHRLFVLHHGMDYFLDSKFTDLLGAGVAHLRGRVDQVI